MATFWDILWAIKGQSLLILLGLLVGAIPLFKDMRKPRGKQKRPLSLSGKIVFVLFATLYLFTIVVLYFDKKDELSREFALSEKSKKDSIKFEQRHQQTLERFEHLNLLYDNSRASDSALRAAIKRGNYKYDSIRGVIISPKTNIQNIAKDGRGIQNNESNFGNQFLGDIQNLNVNEIRASKQELDKIVKDTEILMKKENLTCLTVELNMASNAKALYGQIFKAYSDAGFSPKEASAMSYPIPKKLSVKKGKGNCLVVVVGLFD